MRIQTSDKNKWHDWFAWHPVRIDCEIVWLGRIERMWNQNTNLSCIHADDRGEYAGAWEYRNVR